MINIADHQPVCSSQIGEGAHAHRGRPVFVDSRRGCEGAGGKREPVKEKEEEKKREAARQMLRDLPLEAAAADRKQLLWKEERISILEEAMMAKLRQGRSSEPAGDPASANSAAQPASLSETEGGNTQQDDEPLLIDLEGNWKESEAPAEDTMMEEA
ncbi:hypothetical protein MGYG_03588 [Nannizzia gypsea CBS 118893]|uniref:Uncharacterized protein n=1 Tax=Arthroderma gypseum (strain ATCC MYA-4604 / CBS 118893) TaxID=535722 RepID=E4USR8_ARTGP|nr:hypothetical protein MGYG_03588 [Nannizzia gypsea CBS 118893]EFR00583.1 hypothetical protein MGYG_03588 [Nannizzia gypsea CBS 118893]